MSTIARELFKLADFVIFPVQASEDDLTAAPVTVQALKEVGVPFRLCADPRQGQHSDYRPGRRRAVEARRGCGDVRQRPHRLTNRLIPKGQTITEAEPKGLAAKEIAALWENIKSCLHGNMQEQQKGKSSWLKHSN